MRSFTAALLLGAVSLPAQAQAPETGPLVLLLPASTRATALGNAWVAGRDEDVLFYNPAQLIGARPGFNLSLARYGSASTQGSIASVYAAGPYTMTFGWGLQFVDYTTQQGSEFPVAAADLMIPGHEDALGMLATVGGAFVFKGFRIGAAGKYVTDRIPQTTDVAGTIQLRHDAFLGDFGVARNFLNGIAAVSFQNLGSETTDGVPRITVPRQALVGWSNARPLGQLDVGLAGQLTMREDWVAFGGGVEVGYGWIEGYSVAGRIGARRTETGSERPVALGATFNADHLSIEYAVQFFDGGRTANRMTLRWR